MGFGIQQRILAKKLRELEDKRYEDEKTYSRGRDTVADQRYGEDRDYRRGRDTVADARYGDETTYRRGRDTVGDTRYTDETTYNRRQDASKERRQRLIDAMQMQGGSLGQIGDALKLKQAREAHDANMALTKARTKAVQSGAAGGWEEYDSEGNLVKRRVRPGMGGGQPQAEATDPRAQELANAIAGLQTEVGKHQVEMAGGDMRTGFLGMGGSRQSQIDEANAKIAKLRAMQGGALAQPGAQTSAIDAEMQRRGFVKNPDGKWIKLTAQ